MSTCQTCKYKIFHSYKGSVNILWNGRDWKKFRQSKSMVCWHSKRRHNLLIISKSLWCALEQRSYGFEWRREACFHSSIDARPTCCRIALTEIVAISPGYEMTVNGRPIDCLDKDSIGILDALAARSGLMVAKALVCPKMGIVPICILNLHNKQCFLHRNTVTAFLWASKSKKFWDSYLPYTGKCTKVLLQT